MTCSHMKVILTDLLGNPNCNVPMRLVPTADLLLTFSTRFMPIKSFFFFNYNKWNKRIFPMGTYKWKTPL